MDCTLDPLSIRKIILAQASASTHPTVMEALDQLLVATKLAHADEIKKAIRAEQELRSYDDLDHQLQLFADRFVERWT